MKLLSGLVFVFSSFTVFPQNDTSAPTSNIFTASINYQSRLHYFGRTDSLKSSGLTGTIGYQLKMGAFANANMLFSRNKSQSVAYTGTSVEAGYKFPTSKNFSGSISYTHYFFDNDGQLPQAVVNGDASLNGVYSNKIVNINAEISTKLGNETDWTLSFGFDHLFVYLIPETDLAIAINPAIYAYAGSQKFTETYYINRKVKIKKKNNGNGNGNSSNNPGKTEISEDVNRFKILSYELLVPIVFVSGKVHLSLTPCYVFPQNIIEIANRSDLTENGRNMFYFTASVGIRL